MVSSHTKGKHIKGGNGTEAVINRCNDMIAMAVTLRNEARVLHTRNMVRMSSQTDANYVAFLSSVVSANKANARHFNTVRNLAENVLESIRIMESD